MRGRLSPAFCAALFAIAVGQSALAAAPSDEQSILDSGKNWAALYETGRIAELRPLYEPDAWLMTEGAPLKKGVDAILNFLGRNTAQGTRVRFTTLPEQVTIDGQYGFLIAKYWVSIVQAGGEEAGFAGRSLLIFKRDPDRQWRIWRDIDNRTPDVAMKNRPR